MSTETSVVGAVIIGAGHAGITAAALLRQRGFDAPVTIVGDSEHLPYHRPPLSKSYLSGPDGALDPLRPSEFYRSEGIDLIRGQQVSMIDPDRKVVRLDDGTTLEYSSLILATGARPRDLTIAGSSLRGVTSLHNYEDSLALRDLLGAGPGTKVAIVGAGYVGLEVAAAGLKHGVDITVVERAERALGRVASPDLSTWLSGYHRDRGTRLLTSADLQEFLPGEEGAVRALRLADGTVIDCDGALVGVGVLPCDGLARAAGIHCDSTGVVVDADARTSAPSVYAIGDVTSRPVPPYPGRFRLESIPSATEQAGQAVAAILGLDAPKPEVPWFWSDQFDAKIKIAGLLVDATTAVVRGNPADDRFAVFHLADDDTVRAVETVNSAPEFMAGKRWIAEGVRIDRRRIEDQSIALREVPSGAPVRS
ncbi:NAD(P)/FAD-dependent oxidoreductase [Rhodococcus sp. JVH1]|uniref:NAD(P)/FAD-dependent oxidoreductase n=1 Tax=Rhodococcus sp. JVH1 TaxID=745408 RepID=UPI0002F3E641|nr:FAD-dependent oxidoreductase [Rhodococcus sp. JVH1]